MMNERQTCETMFLANLEWMQQAMAAVSRRYGVIGDEAREFASWAMLRLIENDYGIIRQYRGESSIRTYLVVVITMLHREYRVQCWGRWRPSKAAQRSGRVAVRLETLVHRDGHRLQEAIQLLRTSGETTLTGRELVALFGTLPLRTLGRIIEIPDELADAPGTATADDLVVAAEAFAERRAMAAALQSALASLSAEDQVLVRMHFWERMTLADVARALGIPQRPLYRRVERALAFLRQALETAGFSKLHARALLDQAA